MILGEKFYKYKPERMHKNGTPYIYCSIRKKFIVETSEELIRQSTICFLHEEMKVPFKNIDVEVSMIYFKENSKERADIVVYAEDEEENRIPLIIVECKATGTCLTYDVFEQAKRYNEIIKAKVIMLINGNEVIIKSRDAKNKSYCELDKIPSYKDLLKGSPFIYRPEEYWERPNFEIPYPENVIDDFIELGRLGVDTPQKLHQFICNFGGLIYDEKNKMKPKVLNGLKFIEDKGLRLLSYGDAGGGEVLGEYRHFIVENGKKASQLVSLSVLGFPGFDKQKGKTVIVMAVEDCGKSHNSLILNIDKFADICGDKCRIWHDGTMTVGDKGMIKRKEVLQFIESKSPDLMDSQGNVHL